MDNGANGHQPGELPGFWILIIDGGVGYLARSTNDAMTEEDVAKEMELSGQVRLSLRPVYVLDCVRGAMPDEQRGVQPFAFPITQRLDQRIGMPDDFVVHMTARSVVFLSEVSPAVRTHLARTVENAERAILLIRAKQSGIIAPGART
jgi:hypothetical protein